jgi:hypothetical protein
MSNWYKGDLGSNLDFGKGIASGGCHPVGGRRSHSAVKKVLVSPAPSLIVSLAEKPKTNQVEPLHGKGYTSIFCPLAGNQVSENCV